MMEETLSNENSEEHSITPLPPNDATPTAVAVADADADTRRDWDKLKSMLSFQLKQVLLEYPEVEITSEEQNASLGETYLELVKRLDEGPNEISVIRRILEALLPPLNSHMRSGTCWCGSWVHYSN
ncbi:hypothetical protein SO802_023700 [Lithocarpus litseifolius]|uniref:Uncharacterized protein n=1 Tax=Lithocarpus litseifolius TaxID=425828 RepID=A0AAW2C8X8_9ROSI